MTLLACLLCAVPLGAQKERREPLNEKQIEEVREAGAFPDQRIGLYTKYLNERAETLKALAKRAKGAARSHRLNEELLDFTALMDELGSNLDQYGDRKADLRKALKKLNEDAPQWLEMLHALPSEAGFDLAQKEAVESCRDLAEEASAMLKQQTDYFAVHKDESGQEREEPK
jgi:ABC-type transporter Mla subunit MlaD